MRMTMASQHTFRIMSGLGERLRSEREARGLRQNELAAAGHVTRFTQAGYEGESTHPNTAYLKAIQQTGVDLHYILSGTHQVVANNVHPPYPDIDWDLLQTVFEDVEMFCEIQALKYPSRYRWRMVAELYAHLKHLGCSAPGIANSNKEAMSFLSSHLATLTEHPVLNQKPTLRPLSGFAQNKRMHEDS